MITLRNEQWSSAPVEFKLDFSEAHIWRSPFPQNLSPDNNLLVSLSEKEIKRAQRFVRQSDRDRYLHAHSMLRRILCGYSGCKPEDLVFKTNGYGKPYVNYPVDSQWLQFNLSHSKDMCLIAVAREAPVGIDVEYRRSIPDAHEISKRFFSADENEFLRSLPLKGFEENFFKIWTLKEAFVKGIGRGVSFPFDKFSIVSACRAILESKVPESVNVSNWSIVPLTVGPGYSGAMAIESSNKQAEPFRCSLFELSENVLLTRQINIYNLS